MVLAPKICYSNALYQLIWNQFRSTRIVRMQFGVETKTRLRGCNKRAGDANDFAYTPTGL